MVSSTSSANLSISQANGKHGLYLEQVYCIDETGGNWVTERGADDIYLGGVSLGINGASKIPYFKVGGFDDRDKKIYNPSKLFAPFDQGGASAVIFVLVERDSGDQMEGFLNDLVKQNQTLFSQVMHRIKGAHNFTQDQEDDLKKQILIEVAKEAAKLIKNWIVASRKDDIFEPQIVQYSSSTAVQTVRFTGHNATYDISYRWSNG